MHIGTSSIAVLPQDIKSFSWSPDGKSLAYLTPKDGALNLVIADSAGRVLGRHGGVHRFTVGQRKGLGLSSGQPLYVLSLRQETQTVVVGPRNSLERRTLTTSGMNWIAVPPPSAPLAGTAQIRYRHAEARARVQALDGTRARVEFDEPQHAVAPGQALVFYDGDTVVGGGWID